MIGGLVDYILAEHDDRGKDKLAYAGSKNFLTTTVAAQKREMISLAEESIQSRMPVTLWILSWQENEQPIREQVDEAVSLFLRGMGLAEHQRPFPCTCAVPDTHSRRSPENCTAPPPPRPEP